MFDSGVGGLTLLHEALHVMPDEAYFYYADSDHVPYGLRAKEEVAEYSDGAVEFLLEQGCEAIVIACNTATSVLSPFAFLTAWSSTASLTVAYLIFSSFFSVFPPPGS